jgi:hypothetical protein
MEGSTIHAVIEVGEELTEVVGVVRAIIQEEEGNLEGDMVFSNLETVRVEIVDRNIQEEVEGNTSNMDTTRECTNNTLRTSLRPYRQTHMARHQSSTTHTSIPPSSQMEWPLKCKLRRLCSHKLIPWHLCRRFLRSW